MAPAPPPPPPSGPDVSRVVELLERQRDDGWHDCAQVYVSLRGELLLDATMGESRPGRMLRNDDVMLWYSSGKPLTTVAVLQLWEQGRLGLDDPVADFISGWGAGKEKATIRHLLTHTGGFPMMSDTTYDRDVTYADAVANIAAHPAEWEPGTAAGYHASSGWKILGAIVEVIDGRPIDQYLRGEILEPLHMHRSYLGVPLDVQRELGDRLVPVTWKGYLLPSVDADGAVSMVEYHVDEWHNDPWHIAKVEPAGGMRGPARDLGHFYESLLGYGPTILDPRTVETMSAVHRYGIRDRVFGTSVPWGLGVAVEFTGGTTRRVFGHGGMASSRGFADRQCGLVVTMVTNGLPSFVPAEQRVLEITDAVYSALGDEVAHLRKPVEDLSTALRYST
jgi:CubicO group peptidase (beta-lactamase class C family)